MDALSIELIDFPLPGLARPRGMLGHDTRRLLRHRAATVDLKRGETLRLLPARGSMYVGALRGGVRIHPPGEASSLLGSGQTRLLHRPIVGHDLSIPVEATQDSCLCVAEADCIDRLVALTCLFDALGDSRVLWHRCALTRAAPLLADVPIEAVVPVLRSLRHIDMYAGGILTWEGERTESMFILESGCAQARFSAAVADQASTELLSCGSLVDPGALQGADKCESTVGMISDGTWLAVSRTDLEEARQHAAPPRRVSPAAAHDMMKRGSVIVDVRLPEDGDGLRIPGAVPLPATHLAEAYGQLDRSAPCLTLCRNGIIADAAAVALRALGFDAAAIVGGMEAWPFELEQGRSGAGQELAA